MTEALSLEKLIQNKINEDRKNHADKENTCPLCERHNEYKSGDLYITIVGGYMILDKEPGKYRYIFDIRYCPKCGKRLTEDVNSLRLFRKHLPDTIILGKTGGGYHYHFTGK